MTEEERRGAARIKGKHRGGNEGGKRIPLIQHFHPLHPFGMLLKNQP